MQDFTWLMGEDFDFPAPERANQDGILALGGDVTPRTLRRAYRSGIFPWPIEARLPVAWFCPSERFVLDPADFHVPRSLRRVMRRGTLEIRWDTRFSEVVAACAAPRAGDDATWIDERIARGFAALHASPRRQCVSAHSVEAWCGDQLVGGLYGVSTGGVFCGESMFTRQSDAGKAALVALVERMRERGYSLLDCQVRTEHLARFGAKEIPRRDFLHRLSEVVDQDRTLL